MEFKKLFEKNWVPLFFSVIALTPRETFFNQLAQFTPKIAPNPAEQGITGPLTGPLSIISLINMISVWVATIFWIAAAGAVFYSAYLYLTAAGKEERAGKAKKQLLYAIIAMVIGIMSYGLPLLIEITLYCGASGGGGVVGWLLHLLGLNPCY
jgi:magnesium-transporting ATPase (P-type)